MEYRTRRAGLSSGHKFPKRSVCTSFFTGDTAGGCAELREKPRPNVVVQGGGAGCGAIPLVWENPTLESRLRTSGNVRDAVSRPRARRNVLKNAEDERAPVGWSTGATWFFKMGEHVDLKALCRVSPALPEGTRLSPTRIFARNAVCRSPVLQNTFKSVEEKRAAVAVRAGAVWFFDLSEHEQVGKGFRTGPKKRAVAETTPLLADTIV